MADTKRTQGRKGEKERKDLVPAKLVKQYVYLVVHSSQTDDVL